MDGMYIPPRQMMTRSYSATYTLEASGVLNTYLTYDGTDQTVYDENEWIPIGMTYVSTASSAVCICEISGMSLSQVRLVAKNTTTGTISSRSAVMTLLFVKVS